MRKIKEVIVPIGPSIAYVPLTKGLYALIDSWNAKSIGENNWCATKASHGFYATRASSDRKTILMHVEILRPRPGFVPDHIRNNGLDNRESQLREATRSENGFNRKGIQPNNTSGLIGIQQRTENCWVARIKYKGKDIRKHAPNKERAIELRKELAREHFGEFA